MIAVIFFIMGLIFGSFFQVIGFRIPKGESIITPSSHCEECKHKLKWYELIPVISYIIQGGKCRNCKKHLSIKYPLYEIFTGISFCLSYIVFGLSIDIIIPLTIISILIIVIISDIEYMIISDEVLIAGSILILTETFVINGMMSGIYSLVTGLAGFLLMYGIKLVGDAAFKKESLGGGDIKLFFLLGLVFHFKTLVVIIFASSFIALPYSISVLLMKKDNIVPFGPFISLASILLILLKLTNVSLLDLINYLV